MAKPRPSTDPSQPRIRRCAIYTRKSTDEGLDQEFNSLDAQREACAAYIMSQRHEGWILLPDYYDDGGYSGGNMDRPGLKQLLAEVEAGRVDVIVVYKVDRLTRSLSDFAKIVEVLDAASASFVSITQAFNTTTSMGRLTLNVLLSFAQFEREVISERVRDKVAASKRKGMWMGGRVPLGYEAIDRKLVVNETEAETVRHIMRRYLEVGTVPALCEVLRRENIRTKVQPWTVGSRQGGGYFSRGALYHLLSNRLYRGEIAYRGEIYPGEHDAIVSEELWDAVHAKLQDNGVERPDAIAQQPSLLAGMISDEAGRRLTPSHACKGSRRYRYYVTPDDEAGTAKRPFRLPAGDLERAVLDGLRHALDPAVLIADLESHSCRPKDTGMLVKAATALRASIHSVRPSSRIRLIRAMGLKVLIGDAGITATINLNNLMRELRVELQASDEPLLDTNIDVPVRSVLVRRGKEDRLAIPSADQDPQQRDPALVTLVLKAFDARRLLLGEGSAGLIDTGFHQRYLERLARLGFLAPDIISAIVKGNQPKALTARKLLRVPNLPISWKEQRRLLGFA